MEWIRSELIRGAQPEVPMDLAEWSDAHRILTSKTSMESGPWRTDRTPYTREIMECLSTGSPYRFVYWMKASQIGATEIGNNWLGYIIDTAPGPVVYMMPSTETLKKNVRTRINPLLFDTPRLNGKIPKERSRDGGNTMSLKEFPGGHLIMGTAGAANSLLSDPARYAFLDEAEHYPRDVEGAGDPIKLANARTTTFGRKKKIYVPSTPREKYDSIIEPLFLAGDQRYYELPCPKCGKYQPLDFFKHIKFSDDTEKTNSERAATAVFLCEFCEHESKNGVKEIILPQGHWRATAKAPGDVASFHLSSLYSPVGWLSWEELVLEWLECQGKPLDLKAFYNTRLGKTWEERGVAPDWEKVFNRAGPYARGVVPDVPLIITAGVDIQADRIEMEVVGFGLEGRNYSLDYHVIIGDTQSGEVWRKLESIVHQPIRGEDGLFRPVLAVCIDSGYQTQKVYDFCRANQDLCYPVKGEVDKLAIISRGTPLDVQEDGRKVKGGLALFLVGTDIAKKELYRSLRENDPEAPGYQFFPTGYDHQYFQQLTAESLVPIRSRQTGRVKYRFRPTTDGARNEALDCRVYARAAAEIIGLSRLTPEDWEAFGKITVDGSAPGIAQTQSAKPPPRRRRRSNRGI